MVGRQHRHSAVWIPDHTPAQLQPFQQRRHTQSSTALRKPQLPRIGDYRQAVAVVQSLCVSTAPTQRRFLRQPRQGHIERTGPRYLGFRRTEGHRSPRRSHFPVPRRALQSLEPRQLQHAEPDRLHPVRTLRNSRSNHQHGNDLPTGSIRAETSLVVGCAQSFCSITSVDLITTFRALQNSLVREADYTAV